MSTLNFPSSPIANQIFSSGNTSWEWDGTSWISRGSPVTAASVAANSVRVSANSGSVIAPANGINFVNTTTVTVVVANGINGAANISFTSIGGGGGGGGSGEMELYVGDTYTTTDSNINLGGGWLACDGNVYTKTSYPELANVLANNYLGLSQEPIVWNQITTNIDSDLIIDISYGNGLYVAVTDGMEQNVYYKSSDLIIWTKHYLPNTNSISSLTQVEYANSKWVMLPAQGTNGNSIFVSIDNAATWSEVIVPYPTGSYSYYGSDLTLAANANAFVLICGASGNSGNTWLSYSYDLITWQHPDSKLSGGLYGYPTVELKYANNYWVGVSNDGRIIRSNNLVDWSSAVKITDSSYNTIAFGNNKWIVIESAPKFTHYSLDNGLTWNVKQTADSPFEQGLSAAYIYEYVFNLSYGNGRFVYVNGTKTGAHCSFDGFNYVPYILAENDIIPMYPNNFCKYVNGQFIVCCSQPSFTSNTILFVSNTYSYNSTTQFSVPNITTTYPYKTWIKATGNTRPVV